MRYSDQYNKSKNVKVSSVQKTFQKSGGQRSWLYSLLLVMLLFAGNVVFAQSTKKDALRQLRDYYVAHTPQPKDMKAVKADLKKLNDQGQFSDLIPYENEITGRKLIQKAAFDDQQKMGVYLYRALQRLADMSALYKGKPVTDIPAKFWKSILHYGTMETNRQPNDRFLASCFSIPKAAIGVFFTLNDVMKQIEKGEIRNPEIQSAHRMLQTLAMQSWTQPMRNDSTDKNVVQVARFRHHVWWVGGNALAYRPLLQAAVVMDSTQMVDVLAEVAQRCLSNVSQNTYREAFWNEGFTADGAGWGHGLQCLVWGYPIHGTSAALSMMMLLRNTPWDRKIDRSNADALLNFYRGSNFYHYKGYIPPCLDRYSMVYYEHKHAPVPYLDMLKRTVNDYAYAFRPSELDELKQLIQEATKEDINMANYPQGQYGGTRWFYNNDDLIKKNEKYYLMVNMASVRCDGLEGATGFADEFNLYTNDGLTLFQRQGDEYRKIIGAMDLTALPGITAREGMEKLKPETNWRGFCSKYNFAGGATAGGNNAVAGFIFEKKNATEKEREITIINPVAFGVKAYKSYFMLGDYMVALGAGITNLNTAMEGTIRTTIEQTAYQHPICLYDGIATMPVSKGQHSFSAKNKQTWVVQENGFAYTVLPQYESNAFFCTEQKNNEWLKRNLSNKGKANLPEKADIFRVWIDHGRNVKDGNYGYVVYCGKGMPAKKLPFEVLQNDTLIQAVQLLDRKVTGAVFYRSGVLLDKPGISLSTSAPAVVLLEDMDDELRISVTDPEMNPALDKIDIKLNGYTIPVAMWQGKNGGKSKTIVIHKF